MLNNICLLAPSNAASSDLSNNRLAHGLSRNFTRHPSLVDLYLANNLLEWLADDAFANVAHLHTVSLAANHLKRIDAGAFVPVARTLTQLDLSHNAQLQRLHANGLENVETLRAFGNARLRELPRLRRARSLALTYAYHCCDYYGGDGGEQARRATSSRRWFASLLDWFGGGVDHSQQTGDDDDAKHSDNITDLVVWPTRARTRRHAIYSAVAGGLTTHANRRLWPRDLIDELQLRMRHIAQQEQHFRRHSSNTRPQWNAYHDDSETDFNIGDRVAMWAATNASSAFFTTQARHTRAAALEDLLLDETDFGVATPSQANDTLKNDARVQCVPEPNAFLPCDDLFDSWWLRIGVWAVFLLAFTGNILVIVVLSSVRQTSSTSALTSIMWLAHTKRHIDVPRFLVINLAVADLLMSLYLGLLACVDLATLGEFRMYAIKWQHSIGCKLAGFLAVSSAELSVFILAIITLERNYAITNAVHLNRRLSLQKAMLIMLLGYAFALAMAALPLNGVSDYRRFAICLPLDLDSHAGSQAYAITLLAINTFSFMLLLTCYLRMYCAIRGSQAWNSNDLRIAKRMSILVATDFACWVPIIVCALAALLGRHLVGSGGMKTLTIFVLPLNSVANPFLYAITTKKFKRDLRTLMRRVRALMPAAVKKATANGHADADPDAGGRRHDPPAQAYRCNCACRQQQQQQQQQHRMRLQRRVARGQPQIATCIAQPQQQQRPQTQRDAEECDEARANYQMNLLLSADDERARVVTPVNGVKKAAAPVRCCACQTNETQRRLRRRGGGGSPTPAREVRSDLLDQRPAPNIDVRCVAVQTSSHLMAASGGGSSLRNKTPDGPLATPTSARSQSPRDFLLTVGGYEQQQRSASACGYRLQRSTTTTTQHNNVLIVAPAETCCSQSSSSNHILCGLNAAAACSTTPTTDSARKTAELPPAASRSRSSMNRLLFEPIAKAWSSIQISLGSSLTVAQQQQPVSQQQQDGNNSNSCAAEFANANVIDDILLMGSPSVRVLKISERRMSRSCDLLSQHQHNQRSASLASQSSSANAPTATTMSHDVNTTSGEFDDDRRILLATINRIASVKQGAGALHRMAAYRELTLSDSRARNAAPAYLRSRCTRCRSWSPALLSKLEDCIYQIKTKIGRRPHGDTAAEPMTVINSDCCSTSNATSPQRSAHDDDAAAAAAAATQPLDQVSDSSPADSQDDVSCDEIAELHDESHHSAASPMHSASSDDDDNEHDDNVADDQLNEMAMLEWTRRRRLMIKRTMPAHLSHRQSSITSDTLSTRTGATLMTNMSVSFDSTNAIPAVLSTTAAPSSSANNNNNNNTHHHNILRPSEPNAHD